MTPMTPSSARRLAIWLLPLLAIALEWVDDRMVSLNLAIIDDADGLAWFARFIVASLLLPLVTASLFAYPLARVYSRHAVWAAVLLCLPIAWLNANIRGGAPWKIFAVGTTVWLWAVLAFAVVCWRHWLGPSRLGIVPAPDGEPSGRASLRWLRGLLLPLCAIALYRADLMLALFHGHAISRFLRTAIPAGHVGYLLSPVATATLAALAFAYPVARVYEARALRAAAWMAAPAALYAAAHAVRSFHWRHDWGGAMFFVKALALLTVVPVAAALVQRRLAGSRLVVVAGAQGIDASRHAAGATSLPQPADAARDRETP